MSEKRFALLCMGALALVVVVALYTSPSIFSPHLQVANSGAYFSDTQDLVDINTAVLAELCLLDGIGEVKANAIIAYRQTHGEFTDRKSVV